MRILSAPEGGRIRRFRSFSAVVKPPTGVFVSSGAMRHDDASARSRRPSALAAAGAPCFAAPDAPVARVRRVRSLGRETQWRPRRTGDPATGFPEWLAGPDGQWAWRTSVGPRSPVLAPAVVDGVVYVGGGIASRNLWALDGPGGSGSVAASIGRFRSRDSGRQPRNRRRGHRRRNRVRRFTLATDVPPGTGRSILRSPRSSRSTKTERSWSSATADRPPRG